MTRMVPARQRSIGPRHVFLLIALLCATAGAVDLIAYVRIGHLFVANLTGNTVLFAFEMEQRHWAAAALRLGLILAFFIGVVSNRLLERWIESEKAASNPAIVTLAIECALLATLALLHLTDHLQSALLLGLAWTMGLQNDAFQNIGPVNLNTTFLTGDIAKLGTALTTSVAGPEKNAERRTRIRGFVTAWVAYVAGAVIAAISLRFLDIHALLIPAAITAAGILLELSGRA